MRIAFEVSAVLGTPTGIGHYAAGLLQEMLESTPWIDVSPFALTTKRDLDMLPNQARDSLKRIHIPGRLAVTAWTAVGRPGVFGDFDVVHGTNFWLPPLTRKNGIVTIHDLTFLLYPEMCTPQIRRYRWIVPKVLEQASMVIAPSHTIATQISELLGFPLDRVAVTYEGIRKRFTDAGKDPELERRLGIDGPYLLFMGTSEPRKNLSRLVRSLRQVDGVCLVVAGPGGWGGVDAARTAAEAGVGGRVLVTGYLPESEIASLMAGATAFVFPSIYEGFGLPPLEAMSARVPVVASRSGSLPEILGDGPFWCDPFDEDSIAEALNSALQPGLLRDSAIELGVETARGYTWERTLSLTIAAYEQVAAERRS